jgi:flagellar FliL protein
MSDSDGLDDIDGGESSEASTVKKNKGGLKNLLPTILKFAAIGIGALIFIVTVAAITYNVMRKDGKSQSATADPTSPYIGKRPVYTIYQGIGPITTKTRDTAANYTVSVQMNIGYNVDDPVTGTELNQRQYELRDFVRNYFTRKYAEDLLPENEERLKQDIKEILNTRFLDTAKVQIILFDKLDVMEVF